MKTLLIAATALPFFACALRAQDDKPADAPAEETRKARPAAWLGIAMSEEDGRISAARVVPESPAAKAGVQEGDVLLAMEGKELDGGMKALADRVAAKAPGDTVELRIRRGDKEETLKILLAERPEFAEAERGEFRREESDEAREAARKAMQEAREAAEHAMKEAADAQEKVERKMREKARQAEARKDAERGEKKQEKRPSSDDMARNLGRRMLELELDSSQPKDFPRPFLRWLDGDGPRENMRFYFGPGDAPQKIQPLLRVAGPEAEARIWKQVEQSVGRALKESGLEPEVIGKVMRAVHQAREHARGQHSERERLQQEAAKLEKEMQALRERQEKLRERLKEAE
jgi:PDZ domain